MSNTEILKTPVLNNIIEEQRRRIKEDNEVIEAIPQLRIRLGSLLRHVKYPTEVGGKIIKPSYFEPNEDGVVTSSFWGGLFAKKLSMTGLKCETESEKEKLTVVVKSYAYPFERWEGKDEQRPVVFHVKIKELGYLFRLYPAYPAECGTDKEDGKANLKQIKLLEEMLTLIEDPNKTKYEPLPYSLT